MPTEKAQKAITYPKVGLKDILRSFWRGIKPQKWGLFFIIVFMVFANIVVVTIPIFYKQFFDIISVNGDKNAIASQLLMIIIKIAVLNGFVWLFFRLATLYNSAYQTATIARLKQQSYDYLIEHSYSFFSNNFTGSLVQRVNRFARAFETLSDRLIWDVLPLAVKMISIFTVLLFINHWMALIMLAWACIFLLFNITFSNWKLKYDLKVAQIDSRATGYLADTLSNQNTISLFSGFTRESRGFKEVTGEQARMTKFTWSLDAVIEGGQAFLGFAM